MSNLRDRVSGPIHRDWFGLAAFTPGDRFLRGGGRLYLLDEVGSTNDFLRGLGAPASGRLCLWDGWGWRAQEQRVWPPVVDAGPGTVVVARRQTAGHGRQGRSWLDCGGLNLSVVIPQHRVALDRGFSVWLGLMTVLVVRESLHVDARLKWPNDLVVGHRKLGGILLQRQVIADRSLTVAGLGLNLMTGPGGFPADLQGKATSVVMETGREVRPGLIAGALVNRVEDELDRFEHEGWAPYRQGLANLDCLLGRSIIVKSVGRVYEGRAVGIDDGGALRLETTDGRIELVQVGDVHVLALDQAGGG
ncbi:biotin--[acetyl-CoA-carboxylase] ligase [bacterium]|nr:biotin--[acetyl-CoA-carboxylase] ligase [bacterium]